MSHIHSAGVADEASSCDRQVTNHPSLMNSYLNFTALGKTFKPSIYFYWRLVKVALGKELKYSMRSEFVQF
jgi:hypothetical protein